MTFALSETISVLLAASSGAVPQGFTRTTSLGPMVWSEAALRVVPLGVIRGILALGLVPPVDENNQPPGPSAGCVPTAFDVVVNVYCGLGVLLTCSNVAHSISG